MCRSGYSPELPGNCNDSRPLDPGSPTHLVSGVRPIRLKGHTSAQGMADARRHALERTTRRCDDFAALRVAAAARALRATEYIRGVRSMGVRLQLSSHTGLSAPTAARLHASHCRSHATRAQAPPRAEEGARTEQREQWRDCRHRGELLLVCLNCLQGGRRPQGPDPGALASGAGPISVCTAAEFPNIFNVRRRLRL